MVVNINMRKKFYLVISVLALLLYTGNILAQADNKFDHISAKFELMNSDGDVVTEDILLGKFTLMAFGFTHCLHICPMMAANMALALKTSPPGALGIFVSVDTERDSPAITQAYAAKFSDAMIGLGGTYDQVSQAANSFNVRFVVTKSDKAYTVEHTSDIFLIGPDGKVKQVFALNTSAKDMAKAMQVSVN